MEVWILVRQSWSGNDLAAVWIYDSHEKALEARIRESNDYRWSEDDEAPASPESDEWIFYDNEITLEIKKKIVK